MMVTQMHGLDRLEKGDDLCKGIKFSPQSFLVKPIPIAPKHSVFKIYITSKKL